MTWWAITQRLPLVIATSLLAGIAGVITAGGISFPALSGVPFAEVPYFALTPLLACATLAATGTRATTSTLRTTTRYLALRTLAVALLPVLAAATAGGVAAGAGAPLATAPIRTTAGYVGLQLLTSAVVGSRYQALGPALALFAAALFGRDGSSPARWAWPIDQRTDLIAWMAPTVLLLAGAALHLAIADRGALLRRSPADDHE